MTTMTMNVRSEMDLPAAIKGTHQRLMVTRPSMLADLDLWRARCAKAGKELVADTDASPELLSFLGAHPLVSDAVELISDHGLAVRLLPASYAEAPRDRERMSVWLCTDDESEGPVVSVGLTRDARPAAIAVELARTATMIDEQPQAAHPLSGAIVDAVRQSYALAWVGERGDRQEALRCRDALGRRIARTRLHGGMREDELHVCALRLWAIVTGLGSTLALAQIARIDEQVARAASALLEVTGAAPRSAEQMAVACGELAAAM